MTWTLIYILAGHLHAVPDLPTAEACLRAAEAITEPSARKFRCVQVSEVEA